VSGLVNAGFRPAPPWLSGNLQTVADRVRPREHDLDGVSSEERLLVAMDDGSGDALAIRLHRPLIAPRRDRPIVLVVHGLGGSIDSTYVRASSLGLLRAGYSVARVDLRGVGDSSEHCRMLYHGGRSGDLRSVLRVLAEQPDAQGVAMMGFSLGGNVTLKLLGEPLEGLPVRAGVAVSAPLDLSVGNEHLQRRMFGLYEKFLVGRLKSDTAHSGLALTPEERQAISRVRTLTQFDDLITAKHNGWRDAAEYYAVNSSAQFLPNITVPTLVIHAVDDPMIPVGPYEAIDWPALESATPVRRAITPTGGHVGFHERGADLPWYVPRAVAFLDRT
jgi:predicted alpha/beta-fold hydrolase